MKKTDKNLENIVENSPKKKGWRKLKKGAFRFGAAGLLYLMSVTNCACDGGGGDGNSGPIPEPENYEPVEQIVLVNSGSEPGKIVGNFYNPDSANTFVDVYASYFKGSLDEIQGDAEKVSTINVQDDESYDITIENLDPNARIWVYFMPNEQDDLVERADKLSSGQPEVGHMVYLTFTGHALEDNTKVYIRDKYSDDREILETQDNQAAGMITELPDSMSLDVYLEGHDKVGEFTYQNQGQYIDTINL